MKSKAIFFLLTSDEKKADAALQHFESLLGPSEFKSAWHPYPQGHYYEKEMGPNLKRCFVSFKNIFAPHRLAELKQLAIQFESQTSTLQDSYTPRRQINIDPGTIDLFKVVLASGKAGGQKVALAPGIYAHTLLRFEKGAWLDFPWTFPDFKAPTYHQDFLKIRERLRKELAHRL